jgi:hypothetical protein
MIGMGMRKTHKLKLANASAVKVVQGGAGDRFAYVGCVVVHNPPTIPRQSQQNTLALSCPEDMKFENLLFIRDLLEIGHHPTRD